MPNHLLVRMPLGVVSLFLLLQFTPGWTQSATPSLSKPSHSWWHSNLSLHNLPLSPAIGAAGDFDADGHEDLVVSDKFGVYTAWNSAHGLSPWEKTSLSSNRINQVFWDDVDQVLWVEYFSPGFIEARRWREGAWHIDASFEGSPQSISLSKGLGLVTLKRLGLELELLRSSGEHEILIHGADELTRAFYWEDVRYETRTLVVQDKMSGRLGWIAYQGRSWSDIEWWNDTNITVQWQADVRISSTSDPVIQVLGTTQESLWFKSFDPIDGTELTNWQAQSSLGEVRFHQPRFSEPGRLEVITHNPMTYAARVCELDARTGEVRQMTALEELDVIPFVLNIDLNSDGIREWMYPVLRPASWSIVTDWSPLSQRWTWRNPHSSIRIPRGEQGKLGQGWMDALEELGEVQEVWMHEGKILAKDSTRWWVLEGQPEADVGSSLKEDSTTPRSHQLVLPYLELGNLGTGDAIPGIAEIQPHQWHRVAFSRSEHNDTRVWLDGNLVFRGKSKDLNYLYNAVLIGAYFESHWITHGAVSVDNVVLSGSMWTDDEVKALHLNNRELGPARYTERWEFEDPTFKSERRKRETTAYSQPKLDVGIDGRCVTLDGVDDALRTFLAVPQQGVSLSFSFRFNEEKPSRPHTVATLYGMFNTWFNVVWQPTDFLASSKDQTGVIATPSSCLTSKAPWPAQSSAFVLAETFMVIDSSNTIWQDGPLGWEPRISAPSDMGARRGEAWVSDGCMQLLDASNSMWQWCMDEGWTNLGSVRVQEDLTPTATAHGVLFASDSAWSMWSDPSLPGITSDASDPSIVNVVCSPAGEKFRFSNDEVAMGSMPTLPFGNPTNPLRGPDQGRWMWLALLTLTLALIAWRRRLKAMSQAPQPLNLPEELLLPLQSWIALGGLPLDTQGLDNLLSDAPFETEETRRGRRSRFVREMNVLGAKHGKQDFIHRKKDPHDRRRVVYELDAKLASLLHASDKNMKGPV